MQSIVLPPTTIFSTQFGHPKFGTDPERLPLDLGRSTNARGCSPRALPLPRSMSSSNPARDALETFAESRRSTRPELPQIGTSSTTGTLGPAPASTPSAAPETREPPLQHVVSASGSELSQRPFVNDSLRRLPSVFDRQRTTRPREPPFSTASLVTSPPEAAARPLSHKPTRRTKAHVASACVNCKKKHLGCDSARPCRRCVLAGKAATCVDVTHKKRGRPPLKADEASLRPYPAPLESPSSVAPPQPSQMRRPSTHRATSSRELRPSTDLHFPGRPGGIGMVASTGQPQGWTTSVLPRTMDPALSVPGSLGERRISVSEIPQQVAPGFVPMTGGFNPALNPVRMPLPHESPTLPVVTSPPHYHQPLGLSNPLPNPPYVDSARAVNRPPIGHVATDTRGGSSPESLVRLPPIFSPAYTTGPPGHRLSDPYPTSWSIRPQDRPRPPSRGDIGLISPRTQFRPAISNVEQTELPLTQPGQVTPQRHPMTLPRTRPRDEHAGAEPESGESRPTKRRKMALDDMVND